MVRCWRHGHQTGLRDPEEKTWLCNTDGYVHKMFLILHQKFPQLGSNMRIPETLESDRPTVLLRTFSWCCSSYSSPFSSTSFFVWFLASKLLAVQTPPKSDTVSLGTTLKPHSFLRMEEAVGCDQSRCVIDWQTRASRLPSGHLWLHLSYPHRWKVLWVFEK